MQVVTADEVILIRNKSGFVLLFSVKGSSEVFGIGYVPKELPLSLIFEEVTLILVCY